MTVMNHRKPRLRLLTLKPKTSRHTIRHFIEAMRRHDPLLVEHGKRTAVYSLALGQALNLSDAELSDLCHAALLHDLGKLTLPNEILNQNGLSMIGDYLMTECSPQAGAEILRSWPDLQPIAKIIALHHERWDGSGIPFGMRGSLIPLGARILALTDTVDQLLTQKKLPIQDQTDMVIRILRYLAGSRFDPKIVHVFIEVLDSWLKGVHHPQTQASFWPYEFDERCASLNFPNVTLLCEDPIRMHSKQKEKINPHLKEILELTSTLFYDPAPTSRGL